MNTPPPDPPPAVPGYEIVAEIGRGGMGVVYKARQLSLNRTVALKMVLSGAFAGASERRRFVNESRTVAAVLHPNIVQVFDSGEHAGQLFYTMEWVDGGTLAERMLARRYTPTDAAALVEVLALAVHAAHSAGIIHRDLKPANVFLTADGTPKVGDFGLAKSDRTDMTATRAMMGSPGYMAPEQAAGRARELGPPADVWALGVILYELLTGRPPFQGESVLDTLDRVRFDDPDPPRRANPAVPRDLETVCLKCLQKEPERRYPTALDLADDLRRVLAGKPVRARRVGLVEKVWRGAKRNAAVLALVLLATGLAVGLAVNALGPRRADSAPPDDPAEELLRVVKELDERDPGWRLEQIEAARETMPDAENSALVARAAARHFPEDWPDKALNQMWLDAQNLPPAARFDDAHLAAFRAAAKKLAPAIAEGLKLADMRRGRHAIQYTRDAFSTQLAHTQNCRHIGHLLAMEAALHSHDGDHDGAVVACRAALNAGRSLGSEPILISFLVRLSCATQSVRVVERTLAHGTPAGRELAAYQALLADEAEASVVVNCARGDRGMVHWALTALTAGDAKLEEYLQTDAPKPVGPVSPADIRRIHAWALRDQTAFVEFLKLPTPEQARRVDEWDQDKREVPELVRGFGLFPTHRLVIAHLRGRANLRTGVVAVAAERFRQARGVWPEDLAALVPEYMPAVPPDPYTGAALRYRRLDDGAVVYSTGLDRTDDGGAINYKNPERTGADVGFRLWDAARRGAKR